MADLLTDFLRTVGLKPARKKGSNTKAARLRKKVSTIKKLERKQNSPKYIKQQNLNAAIAAADKMIANLRAGKSKNAK